MKIKNFDFNWPLVGNDHIIEYLAKSIANNKVSGSYIFTGPDNLGKTTVARYFANALVCLNKEQDKGTLPCGQCSACEQVNKQLHGDVHLIKKEKDKKNISIEQIRDFIRILSLASFLNSYKIGIIKHAESLSIEAANALLKTLEEPKTKVVIILITSKIEALPSTIISRSQVLKFNPVKADVIYDYLVEEHKARRSKAKNFSRLCLGRPALAVKFLEDQDFYEGYIERAKTFLNFTNQDINQRLLAVEDLIGTKASGQDSAKLAGRIIEIWQGLVRDLLLTEFGQSELMQHLLFDKEFNKIKIKFKIDKLLGLVKNLRQAEKYLEANVNPKLVLEQIAIGIR